MYVKGQFHDDRCDFDGIIYPLACRWNENAKHKEVEIDQTFSRYT